MSTPSKNQAQDPLSPQDSSGFPSPYTGEYDSTGSSSWNPVVWDAFVEELKENDPEQFDQLQQIRHLHPIPQPQPAAPPQPVIQLPKTGDREIYFLGIFDGGRHQRTVKEKSTFHNFAQQLKETTKYDDKISINFEIMSVVDSFAMEGYLNLESNWENSDKAMYAFQENGETFLRLEDGRTVNMKENVNALKMFKDKSIHNLLTDHGVYYFHSSVDAYFGVRGQIVHLKMKIEPTMVELFDEFPRSTVRRSRRLLIEGFE